MSNIPSQRTAPPAPRRPATITVTELRCPSHGSAPFTAARPPSFPGPYQGYVPRVVGHVVLLVGDAVRMDEMDARITAQALVYADTVTIHGTDPEGVQRIQAALDFALDEAAEEAYLDALMRSDLPAPAQPEDKQEEAA